MKNRLHATPTFSHYNPFPTASASRHAIGDILKNAGSQSPKMKKNVECGQAVIGSCSIGRESRQSRIIIGLELWTKSYPKVQMSLHTFIHFPI